MVARVNGDKMKTFPKAAHKKHFYWSGTATTHRHLSKSPPPMVASSFAQVQYYPTEKEERKRKKTPHHRLVCSDQF